VNEQIPLNASKHTVREIYLRWTTAVILIEKK
jgi:hypothetical protein